MMVGTETRTVQYLFVLICCHGGFAEWLDLTYSFDNTTHYWNPSKLFNLTEEFIGLSEGGYWYESNEYSASEHGGTHLDAPCHFFKGGWTAEQIPVERFIANAAVVDITEKSRLDPDAELTPDDLADWRSVHGGLQYPTIVLVHTGYAAHWTNRSHYFGERPDQPGVRHFPGVGEAAARELSVDPAVVGVGIDTPSIDPGYNALFPAHVTLFSTNRFVLENVGDMSRVPATGARIIALPMKIAGGSGGPVRVVVNVPEQVTTSEGSTSTPPGRRGHGRGHGRRQ